MLLRKVRRFVDGNIYLYCSETRCDDDRIPLGQVHWWDCVNM